jgi:uncharacterized protein YrrD
MRVQSKKRNKKKESLCRKDSVMLKSVKSLRGYTLRAMDGDVGKVHEFYFDDRFWAIRYLVADTGNWLMDRLVLLSTTSLGTPGWEAKVFPVRLTMEQVEKSPPISADEPVSRQMEVDLHGYYGWPPYWNAAAYIAAAQAHADKERRGDPHLRSTREVIGYHIHATDGAIGHVDDFIFEDEDWVMRYLVVDTRNWLPGKKVLVAPQWVASVDWAGMQVNVDLDTEAIEHGPEFDPSLPVNREYEVRLYDYYGRPHYWKRM